MSAAKVLPWSYSSLTAFETCPRRFYLTRIAKVVQEPQTEATIWGNEVHKALEMAVSIGQPLEPRFKEYAPLADKLRRAPGEKHCERKFALTSGFKPTTFFAKDAWFRGVIDLMVTRRKRAAVLDYKTGKVKTDGDQLKLFAAAALALEPEVEKVETGYIWLAHDKTTTAEFTKEDVPAIWQEFVPRVKRMESALENDRWVPNPSGLCRAWCPVGRKNCDFCGS